MAVAGDGNQLAHPAPARMIALAIENKVDGLCRLRTDECVIEIGPGTQGQIRQPIQRVPRADFAWIVESVPPWPVFMACSRS